MAQPNVLKFGAGLFYLGDGASTEAFTKICGFTSMELEISKDTSDSTVPDCDDPDAAAWSMSDVTTQSWKATFEGFAAVAAIPLIEAATWATGSRGVRLYLNGAGVGAGTPARLYAGQAHITMKLSGQHGERWKISVDVTGDGALTTGSVAAPP